MRRLLAILGALLLVAGLPAAGLAGRPFKATDHSVSVYCDGVPSTDGRAFAYFGANVSDLYGPGAFLDVWLSATPDGSPDLSGGFDQVPSVTWDGATLAGAIELVRRDGSAGGSATFSATLTAAGDPASFDDSYRYGNRHVSYSGTSQVFSVAGSLTISDGPVFDLGACFGDESTVTSLETNPNAFVARYSDRFVGCDLVGTNGETGFLFVGLEDDGSVFVDAAAFEAGIGAVGAGFEASGSVDLDLSLYSLETFEPVAGSGHISMQLIATGEDFTNLLQNATFRRVTRGQLIDIEGSLNLDGHVFDLGACIGQDSTTKTIDTFPQGPKPGGKVPTNDLPSGAKLLKPGASTTTQTKGASPASEASYECLTFTDDHTGEVFEIPVGYTVWYTFQGTGSPMTIDTAGSDYDTVTALYTASGGGYAPVADGCVDDSPTPPIGRTLQGSVTIPTVAGTTYFVQIGGFPESFAYGNLRVSLR